MRKPGLYFIIALMVWFFAHSCYITVDGLKDENRKADIALILGNKVNVDGTLSKRLAARMTCG